MLRKSISTSLGVTAIAGGSGLIASYLSGGFSDNFPMKTVVWNSKPTSIPQINEKSGYITDVNVRDRGAKKEMNFLLATSGRDNHPGWTELLKDSKNDKLNLPILIIKGCMNNNDTTVDVTSVRGQMLEKLCDVSFK